MVGEGGVAVGDGGEKEGEGDLEVEGLTDWGGGARCSWDREGVSSLPRCVNSLTACSNGAGPGEEKAILRILDCHRSNARVRLDLCRCLALNASMAVDVEPREIPSSIVGCQYVMLLALMDEC